MSTEKIVRIGGAAGAWGDSPMGTAQLVQADVHYLVMDYLAEVTMSLLARARMKDPQAGYPPDFVAYLKPHLVQIATRGIKVVSNAGGVNPQACGRALEAAAKLAGVCLKVAVVEGDDLMPLAGELRQEGVREWISGAALPDTLLTVNAYLGAVPIAAALGRGADIVITGRCVDSALSLGILMHEFDWSTTDYDRLAAGSLVGHLLECGPQVTGGTFTDWEQVPDWHNIGYPVAECHEDGGFVITKPRDTGGLVTPATVSEQVLYEVGDPAAYLLPDVTADFSRVSLAQVGPHRVHVSGARGRPPTSSYKVSSTYQDGFRAVAMVAIVGPDAARKALRSGQALVERARAIFGSCGAGDFSAVHTEVIGAEASYAEGSRALASREVILRLVVEHPDAKALGLFARELGAAGLSFAPGITGLIGGRPKPTPVVRLYTFLIDKARLSIPRISIADESFEVPIDTRAAHTLQSCAECDPGAAQQVPEDQEMIMVPLMALAHARSGDKGNSSNIAIFCREPESMAHLRLCLTPQRVAEHFAGIVDGNVTRYEAPGLYAFNFVLDDALGGGGMASRRLDSQGKAFAQRALEMMVRVPKNLVQPAA